MSESILEVLRSVFPQLSPQAVRRLFEVAHVVEYPDRAVLCRAGTTGSVFFILVDGEVEVYKTTDQGPRQIDTMRRGHFFGEMSLLLNQPRAADVVAAGPVTVIEIDRDIFERDIQTNPELVTALNRLLIQRLLTQEAKLLANLPDESGKGETTRVFMSYSRANQDFVFRLTDDLILRGVPIWLDQREIGVGTIWSAEIQKALDRCGTMIVVLSPDGVESRHVADEWNYFIEEAKPVVPVVWQDCRIPYQLRRIQHVDFTKQAYEAALEQLIATLRDYA